MSIFPTIFFILFWYTLSQRRITAKKQNRWKNRLWAVSSASSSRESLEHFPNGIYSLDWFLNEIEYEQNLYALRLHTWNYHSCIKHWKGEKKNKRKNETRSTVNSHSMHGSTQRQENPMTMALHVLFPSDERQRTCEKNRLMKPSDRLALCNCAFFPSPFPYRFRNCLLFWRVNRIKSGTREQNSPFMRFIGATKCQTFRYVFLPLGWMFCLWIVCAHVASRAPSFLAYTSVFGRKYLHFTDNTTIE